MALAGLKPIHRSRNQSYVSSWALRFLVASGVAASLSFGCAKSSGGGGATGGGSGKGTGGGTGSGTGGGTASGSGGSSSGSGGSASGTGGSTSGSGGSTSGTGGSSAGTGGSTSTGTGGSMSTGTGGSSPVDASMSDVVCQMADYTFAPKIPNVLVLVDGSGSMFQNITSGGMTTTTWDALRKAVLPIIDSLQTQVNFGLGVFTGVKPSQCPLFQTVPIAPMNSAAIAAMYPTGPLSTMKLETPVTEVLPMIPPMFAAATGNGNNYILFATDGEPDFCDDGNTSCPVDATTAGIQTLALGGTTTYIIGLSSNFNAGTCPMVLQSYANAGQGLPVANPCPGHNIYDECNGVAPWLALASAAGKAPGDALVSYQTVGGGAQVFTPDVTDQTSLTNVLAGLFSGVKSCSFDLDNVDGTSITVNPDKLSSASVLIMGATIPQDATNGWSMATSTELVLNGTACATWKMPNNNDIKFNFPCDSIIFEGGDK